MVKPGLPRPAKRTRIAAPRLQEDWAAAADAPPAMAAHGRWLWRGRKSTSTDPAFNLGLVYRLIEARLFGWRWRPRRAPSARHGAGISRSRLSVGPRRAGYSSLHPGGMRMFIRRDSLRGAPRAPWWSVMWLAPRSLRADCRQFPALYLALSF